MNDRIRELAKEAGFYVNEDGIFVPTTDENVTQITTKFAELIITECLNTVGHYANVDEGIAVAKKNFGVEEYASYDDFYNAMREEYDYGNKQVFDLCMSKAWQDGHAYGYHEVAGHMSDLVDFVEKIIAATKGIE